MESSQNTWIPKVENDKNNISSHHAKFHIHFLTLQKLPTPLIIITYQWNQKFGWVF
jgi:hypothetical protein